MAVESKQQPNGLFGGEGFLVFSYATTDAMKSRAPTVCS